MRTFAIGAAAPLILLAALSSCGERPLTYELWKEPRIVRVVKFEGSAVTQGQLSEWNGKGVEYRKDAAGDYYVTETDVPKMAGSVTIKALLTPVTVTLDGVAFTVWAIAVRH